MTATITKAKQPAAAAPSIDEQLAALEKLQGEIQAAKTVFARVRPSAATVHAEEYLGQAKRAITEFHLIVNRTRAGMAWWNGLDRYERHRLLQAAESIEGRLCSVAKVWELHVAGRV